MLGSMRRYCERCETEVAAAYDEPELRRWVKGYFCLGVPFIPLLGIIGSDYMVMLPMTMVYLVGFGPALGMLREPPKCCECGAAVAHSEGMHPATSGASH
jgi:hypothetical protein